MALLRLAPPDAVAPAAPGMRPARWSHHHHHRQRRRRRLVVVLAILLAGGCVATVLLSFSHLSTLHGMEVAEAGRTGRGGGVVGAAAAAAAAVAAVATPDSNKGSSNGNNGGGDVRHAVAGLQCSAHGGPDLVGDSSEMVYWRDLPEDNKRTSPFYDASSQRRYLTFEPDGGGWYVVGRAFCFNFEF